MGPTQQRVERGGRLVKTVRGVVSLAAISGAWAFPNSVTAQEISCETTPTQGYEICPADWENPIEGSWGLRPSAVTPDGSVVVGDVGILSWAGAFRAVVGEDTFEVLPTLNDDLDIDGYAGNDRYADANDIAADAQIIVGSSWNKRGGSFSTAVRWVQGPVFDGVRVWELESLVPVDAALLPKFGPPEARFFRLSALLPKFGPPEARFFRLSHDDGLVAPSG